jgi:hypothetical protein
MIKVTKTPSTRSNTNDTSIRELADRKIDVIELADGEIEAIAGARNFRAEMERVMRGATGSWNPQFLVRPA